MNKSGLFVLVTIGTTALACSLPTAKPSGNGESGDECSYNLSQALQEASGAGSTCASCVQSHCGSQVDDYQGSGGCGDYLSCICPGGTATTNQSTIESCSTQEQTSGCSASVKAFDSCIAASCASPCNYKGGTSPDGG